MLKPKKINNVFLIENLIKFLRILKNSFGNSDHYEKSKFRVFGN